MPKQYQTLKHHNGNLLTAVDLETTGTDPEVHDIIQIGIQPLTVNFDPHPDFEPFYVSVRPLRPENANPMATRVHHLDMDHLVKYAAHPDDVETALVDYFGELPLAFNRRLIPVAHNGSFEKLFLTKWLGVELYDRMFLGVIRDSQIAATYINDHAATQGRDVPFEKVTLEYLCDYFGIENLNPHDALSDAIAGARLYHRLTQMDVLL